MDIYGILDTSPTTLNYNVTQFLLDYGKVREFQPGHVVFTESDPSQFVYIILDGSAEVSKKDLSGTAKIIAHVEKGTIFGEMGVFLDLKRSATVTAQSALKALELPNHSLLSALSHYPELAIRLLKSLSGKLIVANGRLAMLMHDRLMFWLGYRLLSHSTTNDTTTLSLSELTQESGFDADSIHGAFVEYRRLGLVADLEFPLAGQVRCHEDTNAIRAYLRQQSLRSVDAWERGDGV